MNCEIYRKMNVLAFVKFQSVMGLIFGMICGILYSFGGAIIDILVTLEFLSPTAIQTPGLSDGTFLAFGALIGMPLIGSVAGLCLGIVEVVLYKIFSKWLGRLEIDFDDKG